MLRTFENMLRMNLIRFIHVEIEQFKEQPGGGKLDEFGRLVNSVFYVSQQGENPL